MSTTLVAIADLHGNLPEDLPGGDVLVIAGDVCPITDHGLEFQAGWLTDVFYPWMEGLPHSEALWIAGNHDFVCETEEWTPGGRGQYLCDSGTEIDGLRYHGTPWVPHLPRWAFHASDDDLAAITGAIGEVDVLISHGPPLGIGDELARGGHAGSPALLERLDALPPQLCVFGHIHEAYGQWQRGETELANVAHVDINYAVRLKAAKVFEL